MITSNRIGNGFEMSAIIEAFQIKGMPVLDLGCGEAHYTKQMDDVKLVDILPRCPGTVAADIRKPKEIFPGVKFGATYMLDTIEHLTKEEGFSVLHDLEEISERIMVFTPLGELWVSSESLHPHHHRSGWLPEELETAGFETWSWPDFHLFSNGEKAGAFFAWKPHFDMQSVARQLGIPFQ